MTKVEIVDAHHGAGADISVFIVDSVKTCLAHLVRERGPEGPNIEDAITNVVAFMLGIQREDPDLAEWVRYELLADAPQDLVKLQVQEFGSHLAAIRTRRAGEAS